MLLLGCLDEADLSAGPGGHDREMNPKGALSTAVGLGVGLRSGKHIPP